MMIPKQEKFSALEFYDLIQQYRIALFTSSLKDECVYYIYANTADIQIQFEGRELCYIIKVQAGDGGVLSGIIIKGVEFDCKFLDDKDDDALTMSFKSDVMSEDPSYLVLQK